MLTLAALAVAFPFAWMLLSSFKENHEILSLPDLGGAPHAGELVEVLMHPAFPRWFVKRVIVVVGTTVSVPFFCA